MADTFAYAGGELDLFARAVNWKRYLRAQVTPHLKGAVLEVGAGIGASMRSLCHGRLTTWTCLEPDPRLAERIRRGLCENPPPVPTVVRIATVAGLERRAAYDTVLYIDVLEHIADDRAELEAACRLLRSGGRLVVVAPAHQWLFSLFDTAVGHWRRYSRARLCAVVPGRMTLLQCRYLDSVGMLASGTNRIWLRQTLPGRRQIRFWDRCLVPLSRPLDRLGRYRFGKSVMGVWRPAA